MNPLFDFDGPLTRPRRPRPPSRRLLVAGKLRPADVRNAARHAEQATINLLRELSVAPMLNSLRALARRLTFDSDADAFGVAADSKADIKVVARVVNDLIRAKAK